MGLARKIHLTAAGRAHPFLAGKPPVYSGFISHVDEVTHLPPGAELLATNDFTEVQAIAVDHQAGSFWAVQYHPEYSLRDMARLIVAREPKLLPEGFFADRAALLAYVEQLEALAAAPDRKDLRWQLDIDDDVLSVSVRQLEFANWLERLVLPRLAGK
jgi:GMP synthase (glutamine-hydrolysing)